MALTVKHKFVSAKVDTLDNSRVQPSNWNDDHDLMMGAAAVVGRPAGAGTAAAQEIPMGVTGQALLATATAAAARAAIVADDSQTTIAAAAAKVTPVDADVFVALDSAAGNIFKRVTWANIKATMLAYLQPVLQAAFDARYSLLGHVHTFASLTGKPTTIAGYGITDGLNQTGTVSLAGSSTGITGIPAGVRSVTMSVRSASYNAAGEVQFQLGTAVGYTQAGYDGVTWAAGGAVGFHASGIRTLNNAASDVAHHMLTLKLMDAATNQWNYSCFTAVPGVTYSTWSTGVVTLPGALDRVRIVNSGGASADSGTMSVQYQ